MWFCHNINVYAQHRILHQPWNHQAAEAGVTGLQQALQAAMRPQVIAGIYTTNCSSSEVRPSQTGWGTEAIVSFLPNCRRMASSISSPQADSVRWPTLDQTTRINLL